MGYESQSGSMPIGEVLKAARQRAGLELADVEAETKIRSRYLRALESEQWDALPSPVYARSFLRTYAQLLGLDADALTDEYRLQVTNPRAAGHYPITEPMLRTRRRAEETGRDWTPGRGLVIGVVIAVLLAILVVLGLTGGDEAGNEAPERPSVERQAGEGGGNR